MANSLTRDITLPDTFAESDLKETYILAGAATNRAAELKLTKYTAITSTHISAQITIETSGTWNDETIETVQEIWKRIFKTTNDPNETIHLLQRLSVAIRRCNAVSFLNIFFRRA